MRFIMKTIISITLLFFLLASCNSNRSKEQAEADRIRKQDSIAAIQEIRGPSIEKECKLAYESKKTLHDLIRMDKVKERIMKQYSPLFYDKAVYYTQVVTPITYDNGIYKCSGWEAHASGNNIELAYSSTDDELTVNIALENKKVQSNGEIYYNTEGWEFGIDNYENDFGEIEKKEAVAMYEILTPKGEGFTEFHQRNFAVVVRPNCITFWTDKFGGLSKVKDVRIKDHNSGNIYDLSFNEPFKNDSHGNWFTSIGGFMFGENMNYFINVVSSLQSYTISIRSNYDDNVIISNPKNLSKIKDVHMKILQNQKKLNK